MKIQIIGFSGSGKSTLAKRLADFYNIPILYMDNVHFTGNWVERSLEEENKIVETFLNLNNEWVIDGNYLRVAPQRFLLCDLCLYLDYNRFYCYRKCKERYFKYKGIKRESCNSIEKFDFEFKKWLLYQGRTIKRRIKIKKVFNSVNGKKFRIKNKKQLFIFLRNQLKMDVIEE